MYAVLLCNMRRNDDDTFYGKRPSLAGRPFSLLRLCVPQNRGSEMHKNTCYEAITKISPKHVTKLKKIFFYERIITHIIPKNF